MSMIDEKKSEIAEIVNALRSRDTWRVYKKHRARKIAGRIPKHKCELFADELNNKFISVCDELGIFNMAHDWPKRPDSEKLEIAERIVRRFVSKICTNAKNAQAHADDTDDLCNIPVPEFMVQRCDTGLMSVSNLGVVSINPKWPYYTDLTRFLMDLRHEVTHIVDIFFPNLSPLDSKTRRDAILFYVNGHDDFGLYSDNPLELNANMKRAEFGNLVRTKVALCEYERMRGMMCNSEMTRGR